MSSKRSVAPLHIDLKPSKILLALLGGMHLGAAALSVFLQIAVILKTLLFLILGISMLVNLHKCGWTDLLMPRKYLPMGWRNIRKLIWNADSSWQLFTNEGQSVSADLMRSSFCHPLLVALNFKVDQSNWLNRFVSVVILPDSIDAESFRCLRVRLRTRPFTVQDN